MSIAEAFNPLPTDRLVDKVERLLRAGKTIKEVATALQIGRGVVIAVRRDRCVAVDARRLHPTTSLRFNDPTTVRRSQALVDLSPIDENNLEKIMEQPTGVDDRWHHALSGGLFTDAAVPPSVPGRLCRPATFIPAQSSMALFAQSDGEGP